MEFWSNIRALGRCADLDDYTQEHTGENRSAVVVGLWKGSDDAASRRNNWNKAKTRHEGVCCVASSPLV